MGRDESIVARYGTPYSLDEVRMGIEDHMMDEYHRDLLKFMLLRIEKMGVMLKRLEFVVDYETGGENCAICHYGERQGHNEGCALAALLKEVEK